jgi:hypothetical protein
VVDSVNPGPGEGAEDAAPEPESRSNATSEPATVPEPATEPDSKPESATEPEPVTAPRPAAPEQPGTPQEQEHPPTPAGAKTGTVSPLPHPPHPHDEGVAARVEDHVKSELAAAGATRTGPRAVGEDAPDDEPYRAGWFFDNPSLGRAIRYTFAEKRLARAVFVNALLLVVILAVA